MDGGIHEPPDSPGGLTCFIPPFGGWWGLGICLAVASALAADWPQWRGPQRDNVWLEPGTKRLTNLPPAEARWRTGIGFGFSSPVVAKGQVIVHDLVLNRPTSQERVQCFDVSSGRLQWSQSCDVVSPEWAFTPGQETGPNATPVVDGDRVYTLGWHGHLHCINTHDGTVVWKRALSSDYPGAELRTTPSPLIIDGLLILAIGGKPGASVVALEAKTGREVWRSLDEGIGYSSPVVITHGGVRQLIIWTPESIASLSPASGAVLWRRPMVIPADMVVSTPVFDRDRLLVGGLMFHLGKDNQEPILVWPDDPKPTRRVLSVTSTAFLNGDQVYSARLNGEFVCLDARDGNPLWSTNSVTDLKPGATVHITPAGESVLLFNDRGELILARLSPGGYRELARTFVVTPRNPFAGRNVAWAPPAFADGCVFARTGSELVCVALWPAR